MKAYSEACARNQEPILEILSPIFKDRTHVLEIGSGTGQHAVFFAAHLPRLIWQTSDLAANHPSIEAWIDEAKLANVRAPLKIAAADHEWPIASVDAIFSANAVHIMSWVNVIELFKGIGRTLGPGGILFLYGPFNYDGKFTSESNARFDEWLKNNNPESGIRDFEAVDQLAREQNLVFTQDIAMPSNNRCLVWSRA